MFFFITKSKYVILSQLRPYVAAKDSLKSHIQQCVFDQSYYSSFHIFVFLVCQVLKILFCRLNRTWKGKTRVTSYELRVKARVGGLKARVRRLKTRVEAIKPLVR